MKWHPWKDRADTSDKQVSAAEEQLKDVKSQRQQTEQVAHTAYRHDMENHIAIGLHKLYSRGGH